jgi:AcrR family transcriptional regulator
VARNPEATRRDLLDTAARLFAERGVSDVSLNEITIAAGQRNASALQYHFGNRGGLLYALLARHVPGIGERRRELIAVADADPRDARLAAEAFVLPLAELLAGDWRGLAFLRVNAELQAFPGRALTDEIRALLRETSAQEAYERILAHAGDLPPEVRTERTRCGAMMVLHALADRARLLAEDPARPRAGAELFTSNLVDMYLGATLAPVGWRTRV